MVRNSRSNFRKNKAPYLGKINLYWCKTHNLPLLKAKICPVCNNEAEQIKLTPPGDIRPAFEKELNRIRNLIDEIYGDGVGLLLFPMNKIILINKVPGIDLSSEVIVDGKVFGNYFYNPIESRYNFKIKKPAGIKLMELTITQNIDLKGVIEISDDTVSYILEGKSILAPGIIGYSKNIKKGTYCIIKNQNQYVTTALTYTNFDEIEEMVKISHGKVARNFKKEINKDFILDKANDKKEAEKDISIEKIENIFTNDYKSNWKIVYEFNKLHMEEMINEAKEFIIKTKRKQPENRKMAVAYSGGKDSLCVLLLAFDALGANFKIFFADTGLELPEIFANTHEVARILGMEDKLHIKGAGNKFWEIIESFGPPSRDYRFCCHTLKAQQISALIEEIADGEKILSFLGQRRYESYNRAAEKRVYVNSFIPLQIAAAPIKEWNALEVWLYLLYHQHKVNGNITNIPITELYFEGFERLGCYLCPASNLHSLNLTTELHPELMNKWYDWLKEYSKKYNYPEEWFKFGLWRYKQTNKQWRDELKRKGIKYEPKPRNDFEDVKISITKGFSPCVKGGYSTKGRVSIAVDLDLVNKIIGIIDGNSEFHDDLGVITIKNKKYKINIFSDGSFFIRVKDKFFKMDKLVKKVVGIILRSQLCNGCNTCVTICPEKIQRIKKDEDKKIVYPYIAKSDISKCTHCFNCNTHCSIYQKFRDYIGS